MEEERRGVTAGFWPTASNAIPREYATVREMSCVKLEDSRGDPPV